MNWSPIEVALLGGGPAGLESGEGEAAGRRGANRRRGGCRSSQTRELKPGVTSLDDLPPQGMIDPHHVRFCQDSISAVFKGGEGTIEQLTARLRSGAVDPRSVVPIRLFERGGKLYALDNRRLWAFREAGVPVPYRKATPDEVRKEVPRKFNPSDDGRTIRVRGAP